MTAAEHPKNPGRGVGWLSVAVEGVTETRALYIERECGISEGAEVLRGQESG